MLAGRFGFGSHPEVVIRMDRLRWIVQLSCRLAFGGLAGTCVIDLYSGVSTTPVEIMVEDRMPDFLELASTDSRGCDYVYSPDGGSKTYLGFPRASCTPVEMCAVDSNFPRVSCTPVEMCAVDSKFPRARFLPGEICAERQGLYKVGFVDGIASVYAYHDWITPLRISPQTCPGLFLFDVVSSSVD